MRIHLVAIGGAIMHNLAIALSRNGHKVSGSDDELYNPARDRLAAAGLLPAQMGWFPGQITREIDLVILGMHARADNPELRRAQELGITVYSYPEFIYNHAQNKIRCVVAGSHGKTTTTAMVMHALRQAGLDFDYLVGAQLEGFDTMVRLSDAPILVVEGDEYFASPLDPTAKMVRYHPHHAILTGIAWDHVNVFPTFASYLEQFERLLDSIEPGGSLIWYAQDPELRALVEREEGKRKEEKGERKREKGDGSLTGAAWESIAYDPFPAVVQEGRMFLLREGQDPMEMQIFGAHNLLNARAAALLCAQLGVPEDQFVASLASFRGAAKRLQLLARTATAAAWLDFAHAPSKVQATVAAVRELYPHRQLVACLELHTFSSLSQEFIPQYRGALDPADEAVVFYSPHTLEMKKLPAFSEGFLREAFGHPRLHIVTSAEELRRLLVDMNWQERNLLLMSSGTFGGLEVEKVVLECLGV